LLTWACEKKQNKTIKQTNFLLLFFGFMLDFWREKEPLLFRRGFFLFGGQYLKTKAKTNPPIQLYKEPAMEWTLGIVQNNGPLYFFNLFLIIVTYAR
jgi:hypothetical protein